MRVLKMRAPAILLPAALALTVPARGAVGRAPEPAPAAPTTAAATYPKINPPDEYSYLENNNDPRTVAWVKAQNEKTAAALESSPEFRRNFAMTLALNDAVETPLASQRLMLKDGWVYQLWVDNEHPRGTWRRARLSSFLSASPVWQALLDVDALAAQTGRPIQLVNSAEFSPNGRRCIVRLSNGWSNIIEFREFDLEKRDFVEHGFEIPEGIAGNAVWYDADTLIVSGKFGNPDETVESGWDKVVKKWKRGTPLKDAETIFRGEPRDLGVRVEQQELPPAQLASLRAAGREAVTIMRLSFDDAGNRASGASGVLYSSWLLGQDDQPRRMATPSNVPYPRAAKDDFIFPIERDWSVGGQVWRAGSLLAIPAEDIGSATPRVQLVFRPSDEQRIANIAVAGDSIFILGSHLGSSIGWIARKTGERWSVRKVQFPQIGSAQISMVERGDVILDYQGIAQPSTYFRVDFAKGKIVPTGRHPADAGRNVNVERFEVRSADGALVPYLVARSATTRFDGQAPALVVGYGAYGGDQVPVYYPSLKRLWIDRGGIFVIANIRGGLERGLKWHVRGADRQRTYDDIYAVAEDLVRRKISAPRKIGVQGHSAGGLVAGFMLTQHPELVGAALLEASVLDNFRYDLVILGFNAQAPELGSPAIPRERAFLERTSPFQNLGKKNTPPPLIMVATNDPQVPPAQPRRFGAKMEALGLPFFYHENANGGHAMAEPGPDMARLEALIYTYLWRQLTPQGQH